MKRSEIVAVARSYIDVPWIHQGRSKEFGVDCIGVLICAARELGIQCEDFTEYRYGTKNWPLLYKMLRETGLTLVQRADMDLGQVIFFEGYNGNVHAGFVADGGAPFSAIHGYEVVQPPRVVENVLDPRWMKIRSLWELPGVSD